MLRNKLKEYIEEAINYTAKTGLKEELKSIYFEKRGEKSLNLVATDSYRLLKIEVESDFEINQSFILAKKEVKELLKFLSKKYYETIKIFYDDIKKEATFFGIFKKITLPVLNGTFPNYEVIMPNLEITQKFLSVENGFSKKIEDFSKIINSKENEIILIDNEIKTFVKIDNNEIEIKVNIEIKFENKVKLNVHYLHDAIKKSICYIYIIDNTRPITIIDQNKTILIMPLR